MLNPEVAERKGHGPCRAARPGSAPVAEPLPHVVERRIEGTAAGVVERQRELDGAVVVEVADGEVRPA